MHPTANNHRNYLSTHRGTTPASQTRLTWLMYLHPSLAGQAWRMATSQPIHCHRVKTHRHLRKALLRLRPQFAQQKIHSLKGTHVIHTPQIHSHNPRHVHGNSHHRQPALQLDLWLPIAPAMLDTAMPLQSYRHCATQSRNYAPTTSGHHK
jgi:hypothetical protein